MNDLVKNKNYVDLIQNIESIITEAKGEIATTVNQVIVQTYWSIGRHIVEYEQGGNEKAEYGKQLLRQLSKDLTLRLGKGYSHSNLSWGVIKANVKSAEGVAIIIEISGSDGDIEIDYFSEELRYRSLNHPEWISEDCSPQKPYADWPGVHETISAFIDAAISGNLDCGNAKAVAALSKIGLAADESKDTENWAEVKA